MENIQFCVAVCVVTYNQEKYIAQTLNSVLSQKTDFEIVIFIGNDCSTDRTLTICLEYQTKYPEKIKIITPKSNTGTVSNTFAVFRKILEDAKKYKYVAMLDGDDYWVDEYKLQKQIDFLESNPDYGLVHTRVALLNDKSGVVYAGAERTVSTGYIFPKSLEEPMANCTVVLKTEFLKHVDMASIEKLGLLSCDYITNVIVSKWSKVGFINDITAVWRRNISSVSSPQQIEKSLKYIEHEINSGKYLSSLFPDVYPFTEIEQNRYIARREMEIALSFGDYKLAKKAFSYRDVFKNRKYLKLCLMNSTFFSIFLFIRKKTQVIRHKLKSIIQTTNKWNYRKLKTKVSQVFYGEC